MARRRRSSIADFFEGFNQGWDTVGEVGDAFETNRIRRQAALEPESVEGGFTSEQGEQLRQAALQGQNVTWDADAGAYAVGAPGGAQQLVSGLGRHTYLGQEQATPFTDEERRGLRTDRLAEATTRWRGAEAGDAVRTRATRAEADELTMDAARRAGKKSKEDAKKEEAKEAALQSVNQKIFTAFNAVKQGDLAPAQELFNEYVGKSAINTDPSFPGYASFNPETGAVTVVTNGFDDDLGIPSTMEMPMVQWMGFVQDAATKADDGNPLSMLNAWTNSLNDEQKRRMDLSDKRSAITRREDLSTFGALRAVGEGGGRGSSSRGSKAASGWEPQVDGFMDPSTATIDAMRKADPWLDNAFKALLDGQKETGTAATPEARQQIEQFVAAYRRDREVERVAPKVALALQEEMPENVARILFEQGYDERFIAYLFQQMGVGGDAPDERVGHVPAQLTPYAQQRLAALEQGEPAAPAVAGRPAAAEPRAVGIPRLPGEAETDAGPTPAQQAAMDELMQRRRAADAAALKREQERELRRSRALAGRR